MPKLDLITQAELAAVLATYNQLRCTILDIRRRLNSDVPVEPGIYTADDNPGDPVSGFECAITSIGLFGMDLETKGLPSQIYVEPASEKAEPELPEWLAETPYDVAYRLAMRDSGANGEYSQVVDLTRKEFLILKVCLAKLRGIPIHGKRTQGIYSGDAVWVELEPEEIASVEVHHA